MADVNHPLVHSTNHVRGAVDLTHEVHRFGSAPHSDAQPVRSRDSEGFGRDGVLGDAVIQGSDAVRFHPNQRRVVEHTDRKSTRSQENELVEAEVQRQRSLAVSTTDIVDQELRLQVEQVLVARDPAFGHFDAVHVAKVCIRIQVTCFPNALIVGIDQDGVQPKLWLSTEGTGGQVVTGADVVDSVAHLERHATWGVVKNTGSLT